MAWDISQEGQHSGSNVMPDMDIIIDKTNSMTYRTHAALRFSFCVSSIRKRVSDREGTHELVEHFEALFAWTPRNGRKILEVEKFP